jgi:diadenosine tetraphosphate (Ap4A) HIT family hydrolase
MRILEPSRAAYRKKYSKFQTCQFCLSSVIRDQGIPELDTQYWRVIACKYPYLDGNLMILSKRHVEHTDDLTVEEWADFPIVLKKAQHALSILFHTNSFNLGFNIGPESGRSIAHLHWMLLPRPSRMRSVPVFEALNDLIVVTMGYKTLIKKIKSNTKRKKQKRTR